MDPFYYVLPADSFPQTPEYWSWSSLTEWRTCPKRWWLRRCHYPNVYSKTYPSTVHYSSVHGNVVHDVVEEYCKQRRQGTIQSFGEFKNAFRFVKLRLKKRILDLGSNPRTNSKQIESRLSIDRCMADFVKIAKKLSYSLSKSDQKGEAKNRANDYPIRFAEEYELQCEDPMLHGRIDQIQDMKLIDFKTGDLDPETSTRHQEQLKFYSLIWWNKFKSAPKGLELHYSDGKVLSVPPIAEENYDKALCQIGEEITDARACINSPPPPACPSTDTCKFCPVRQLCDSYWTSDETLPLRSLTQSIDEKGHGYCDVNISKIPNNWKPGSPIIGLSQSKEFGTIQLSITKSKCPGELQPRKDQLRVLGGLVESQGNEIKVKSSAYTEVFWN